MAIMIQHQQQVSHPEHLVVLESLSEATTNNNSNNNNNQINQNSNSNSNGCKTVNDCSNNNNDNNYTNQNNLLSTSTINGSKNLKATSPTPTATISLRKRSTHKINDDDKEQIQKQQRDKDNKENKDNKDNKDKDNKESDLNVTIKLKSRRNSDIKKVIINDDETNNVDDTTEKNDENDVTTNSILKSNGKSYNSRKNSNNNDDNLLSTSPNSSNKLTTSESGSQLSSKQQQPQHQELRLNNSNEFCNSNGAFNDVIGSLTLHDSKPISSTISNKRITTTTTTNNSSKSNPSSNSSSPSNRQQQIKLNNSKNLSSIHKTQYSTYRDTNFLKTECELARSQLVKSTIAKFNQQQQHNLDKASDDNSNNNSNNGIINISNNSTVNNNHSVQTKNNHLCDNNNVNTVIIADNIKQQKISSNSSASTATRICSGDYASNNKVSGSSNNATVSNKLLIHHNSRTTKLSPLVHKTGERIANTTKQLLQQQQPKISIISKNQNQDLIQRQQQQQLQNNNMNCIQNSPDLLDDIKYIDSDDSERHPSQHSCSSNQQQQIKQNSQSNNQVGSGIIAKQNALKESLNTASTTSTVAVGAHHSSNLRFINGSLTPSSVQLKSSTLPIANTAKYRTQNLLASNNIFLKNHQSINSSDITKTAACHNPNIKYNTLNDFKRTSSSNNSSTILGAGSGSTSLSNGGKSTSIGAGNVRNAFNSINNSINKPILTSLKNSTVIVSSDLNINNDNNINAISSKKNFNVSNATSSSSSLSCSSPVSHEQQQSTKYHYQQQQQQQHYPFSSVSNFKTKLSSTTGPTILNTSSVTSNLLRNNSCNSRESTPSSSPQLLKRNFNNSFLQQHQQQNGSNSSLNSVGSNSNSNINNTGTTLINHNQKHNQQYHQHHHHHHQQQHHHHQNHQQQHSQQTPKEIFFNSGNSYSSGNRTNTPPLQTSSSVSISVLNSTTASNITNNITTITTTAATTSTTESTNSINYNKYGGRNSSTIISITNNKENNISNIEIKDNNTISGTTPSNTTTTKLGTPSTVTTTAIESKSHSNRNKCDNEESVRSTSIRSTLPPSPTPSRYWERETATGGRSSSRHLTTSSNNDNDDYISSSKNDSSSDSYEKGGTEGLCGLRNIGNTCFMNSVIQCLSHTKELAKFLKTQTNSKSSSKDGQILYEFAKLIRDMWTTNVTSVTPLELKSAFSSKHRMYSGYNQQDAQEFLRFFLDSLHSALNNGVKGEQLKIDDHLSDNKKADLTWEWYSKVENSMIKDLFVGQLKSTLKCTTCGNTSVTFDPFWDLSVPLPSSSRCKLESCLDLFIKEEVLDGDEMPTCSKCKTRRKCTKSFTIQRFPRYLVIHLKRFSETRWSKLSNIVEFPTGERELNMAPYASNSNTNVYYSLYGISNHMGSTAGGHYVALCKHAVSKKWHEFNDNIVSDELSESHLVSSSAYLLFYERA
ncbi:ubiquitin carboxyl-terminal hydrolase Usp2 isoform X2 [Condylostylus longicornis]|nr:ubiquitin carboxyl-terminal hydrolase Usp2 isoform X2 [Condylostylus longicornis]